MVDQITILGPIIVSGAIEYGNNVVPGSPLCALQRPKLRNLAAADGHRYRLSMLGTPHQITGILAEFPQSYFCHTPIVALVLPGESPMEGTVCEVMAFASLVAVLAGVSGLRR